MKYHSFLPSAATRLLLCWLYLFSPTRRVVLIFFLKSFGFHGEVFAHLPIPQGTNSLLDPLPARHVGLSSAGWAASDHKTCYRTFLFIKSQSYLARILIWAGRLKVEGECSKRGRKRDIKRDTSLFCTGCRGVVQLIPLQKTKNFLKRMRTSRREGEEGHSQKKEMAPAAPG
jgi:hypothetical protein